MSEVVSCGGAKARKSSIMSGNNGTYRANKAYRPYMVDVGVMSLWRCGGEWDWRKCRK